MLCAMELSACRKLVMTLRGINWLLMICVVSLRQRAQPSSGWMQEAVPLDSIGPLRSSSRAGTDLHTTYNPPNRANTLEHANTIQYTHTSHHITPSPYIILYPNPNTQKLDADLTTCCNCKHHKARCVFKTMCLCVCGGGTCEAMCWYAWMGHEQFRTGYVRRPYPAY